MNNDRNKLYQYFQDLNEQSKRKRFDVFMDTLESGLTKKLDDAFKSGDTEKYERLKNSIKQKTGARIFRNSEGKHKLKWEVM